MKYEIMFRIMMRLLQKRKITAREISERYEVSVRSVYRYIEELIVCGVPIDVERGRYGGITIADTFRLPVGYFTKDEYAATVNALSAMSSQISDASIISAIEKLQSTQKNERRDLSVCGNIIVDGGSWGDGARFSEKMFVCEKAVNECKSILIDYISRAGEHSKRVIDPHVLILKQNIWYVYAFCRSKQEFRTFKIGRIRSATFTGAQFKKREISREELDFDFSYSDRQLLNVTLEIEKSSLADAEEWLGVDNIEPRGETFIAIMQLPDDSVLVNKILGYGGAVKVIDPPELKERVKQAAIKIAQS